MRLAVFLAAALALAPGAAGPALAQKNGKPLRIVSIDTEGGAATLFVTPEGKSLLIDTGWPEGFGEMPSPDGTGQAADRIVKAAKKLGVTKLDYVIITHYHDDHSGGAPALAAKMAVGTFIDHGPNGDPLPPGTPPEKVINRPAGQYARYVGAVNGHPRVIAKAGDVFRIGSLSDTIVASDGKLIANPLPGAGAANPHCGIKGADRTMPANENTRSVASLLRFGKVTIAQFGDLSWDREYALACPINRIGKVNLFLVTQHGDDDVSNNPALVRAMRPDVAIMPNGGKKGGGPKTIRLLAALPGLQGFWRLHDSYAHPELIGNPARIANLNPPRAAIEKVADKPYEAPPDMGFNIEAEVFADGTITVINTRNGSRRTYHVD
jgi:beta-lactamase superfamily II metal-dependent hydrolase